MMENDYAWSSMESSGCHSMGPPTSYPSTMYHHNNHQQNVSLNNPCQMGKIQRHKSVEPASNMRLPVSLPGYDHSSPEFKRQRSMPLTDSMRVRAHDSNSQFYREQEPMDSVSPTCEAVPVHVGLMRAMNDRKLIGINPISSGIHSNSHFERIPQGSNGQQTPGRPLRLDITQATRYRDRPHHQDFISPGPTPTTPSTPLELLQHIANEKQFQPHDGYQELVMMKTEQELLKSKGGANSYGQQSGLFLRDGTIVDSQCLSRQRSPNGPANTFPQRLKPTPQQMNKSASVPTNVKLSEYTKKAFRHIKVFVTYAADDKQHTKRVLRLCECLEKNGFRCCVDIWQRKLPEDKRHNWYRDRFEEADFILVVLSPKYRRETDTFEMDNDADDSMDSDEEERSGQSYQLHTKKIYKLMCSEYTQSRSSQRFVPLVFPGMVKDLIPHWLIGSNNKPFYKWPDQYKDLLWMLTKPENRVPEHTPTVNRSLSEDSQNIENEAVVENGHLE
ncbi:CIKS-like protein [Mya arenaria]|uniref:CIKS-like protein n=2 Tax=Mya arenaria TaxID=6604 RepID=A0ABY7E2G8_MYAAR|nr:uncharacterized protein LOC128231487 isoform X2 [Mya arenaria]WAR03008.1 CIKS-like protein [Mya arenaria]